MRDRSETSTVRPDHTRTAPGQYRPPEDQVGELAEEFLERQRLGERPSVEEYAAAHPELAGEIHRLFPALLMMEELKPGSRDLTNSRTAQGAVPERLGDYRILREVGRGGMGVVYEAEQESLGRRVALKVLATSGLRNPKQLLRFHREARATARLHHTNIVPVFGVGESEGQHYYVMQFIPGLGLDAVLDEIRRLRGPHSRDDTAGAFAGAGEPKSASMARSLMRGEFTAAQTQDIAQKRTAPNQSTPTATTAASSVALPGPDGRSSAVDTTARYARSVALIGVQVAEALDYAHRQGILHRDIKPSNLLLDGHGTVWVADFGLAKAADSDDLTHTGDIVGTVRYMAPERFEGRCDARSDVYALGLTLYELLALRPAFDESDRNGLIRQVTHAEPSRLRAVDPTIPRDLETVVRKAIEREPERRYADAATFAEDLRRFVEGRPIRARRTSPLEHAWRWCVRNPAWAALAATVFILLVLAAAWRSEVMRRQARQGPARHAFEAALAQAAEFQRQDLWSEAHGVLEQAEGLLVDAGVRSLRGRLNQARADLELATRLDSNAIATMDFFRSKSGHGVVAAEYAASFRSAGLAADDDVADTEAVASAIRGSAINVQLVAALDDWALVTADVRLRARLLKIAELADPDPAWRDRVRDPAVRGNRRALERLAADVGEASAKEQPPQLLVTLARLLEEVGGNPAPLLRAAQRQRPWDFWLNFGLGDLLRATRPAESLGFYRAAIARRPRISPLFNNLGIALAATGARDEAIASYRKAIALDPKDSGAPYFNLGNALMDAGARDEAIAAFRKSIEVEPARAGGAYLNLGNALKDAGARDEAIAAFRKSIEVEPARSGGAYLNLGNALTDVGARDEAIAAFRKSIELDPELRGAAYQSLGKALMGAGGREEAIAAFRKSIELDPDHARATYCELGKALAAAGAPEEAIAAFRKSIDLDLTWVPARRGLEELLAVVAQDRARDESHRRAIASLTETFPDDHDAWNHAASLWAQTGDCVGYREHCRRMLDKFRQTTDPEIAERTAKACLILPLGGPEQQAACELADRAVAMARGHWAEAWAEATRALAAYRRQRFGDAVEWAAQSLSRQGTTWNCEIPAHLVRAMAQFRLGRFAEARASLARASDLYRTKVVNRGARAEEGDWHDKVICEILQGEAQADLLDRDFPVDPFGD
jgi:serine/threonine protein kinase/Flp pilus assembly protein TadD